MPTYHRGLPIAKLVEFPCRLQGLQWARLTDCLRPDSNRFLIPLPFLNLLSSVNFHHPCLCSQCLIISINIGHSTLASTFVLNSSLDLHYSSLVSTQDDTPPECAHALCFPIFVRPFSEILSFLFRYLCWCPSSPLTFPNPGQF